MSDHWINIVPIPTGHVPPLDKIQTALNYLRNSAPESDEIKAIMHDRTQLFDCGANLEEIKCPHCHAKIDFDWWEQSISDDYNKTNGNPGFQLKGHPLPCCSVSARLDELIYDFHQAFGKFALSAMNPNIGLVQSDHIEKFEAILECKLTVVYEHI